MGGGRWLGVGVQVFVMIIKSSNGKGVVLGTDGRLSDS